MNPSVNPLVFASQKIATSPEQNKFMKELSQLLNQMVSVISSLQNASAAATTPQTKNLGALASNTTFNAQGSLFVSLTFSFAVAFTLTINNLPFGALLQMNMTNTSGAAKIVTGVATTPTGASYTSWLVDAPAAQKNLLTGWSFAVGTLFVLGMSQSDLSISQLAQ